MAVDVRRATQHPEPKNPLAPSLVDVELVKIGGVWYTTDDASVEAGVEAVGAFRYEGDVLTIVEGQTVHALKVRRQGSDFTLLYGSPVLLHYAPTAHVRGLAFTRASSAGYSVEIPDEQLSYEPGATEFTFARASVATYSAELADEVIRYEPGSAGYTFSRASVATYLEDV